MSTVEQYQAIVIGSGQGGNPLCGALAGAGLRTALVERKHIGGTCINEGCTPTKTMVASARVAYLARRGGGLRGADRKPLRGSGKGEAAQTGHCGQLSRGRPGAAGEDREPGADLRRSAVYRPSQRAGAAERRRGTDAGGGADLHQRGRASRRSGVGRTERRTVPGQHVDYGIGGRARAPAGVGRGLCGAGVRADVPPFRQPRDHRPFRHRNC